MRTPQTKLLGSIAIAWVALLQTRWVLRFGSLNSITPYLEPLKNRENANRPFTFYTHWHEAVRVAGRLHFGQPTCLPKALTLVRLLRQRGANAHLCLGVATRSGVLKSHAWVEVGGAMVNEPASVQHDFTRVNLAQWLGQAEAA